MEEALISGDTPWAIQLINRGMDVNSVDAAGNTLLMQAVQRDNMDFFDYLLKRRARINTRNRNGETALSLAAYRGKLPFVKRLVEAGADVNLYGWPPLIYAAFNGHARWSTTCSERRRGQRDDQERFDGAALCRTLRTPRGRRSCCCRTRPTRTSPTSVARRPSTGH
jgi:ankyrin repeat protein